MNEYAPPEFEGTVKFNYGNISEGKNAQAVQILDNNNNWVNYTLQEGFNKLSGK
jgi:hypothetical protein